MIDEVEIFDIISKVMDDFANPNGCLEIERYDRQDFQDVLTKEIKKYIGTCAEDYDDESKQLSLVGPQFDLCDDNDPITMKFLKEMRNE